MFDVASPGRSRRVHEPNGCRNVRHLRRWRTLPGARRHGADPVLSLAELGRLNAVTAGSLELEGRVFAHDTNEFGYKFKASGVDRVVLAYGAVVFQAARTYFAWSGNGLADFQAVFVDLLTGSPADLCRCEIVVRVPESRRTRSYGWDGHSLITW